MRPVNDKLASDILEAGKKEFLEKGYEKASLRAIASTLGVTTGAIYRYYQDKEVLFQTIVKEPAEQLINQYRSIQLSFAAMPVKEQLSKLEEVSKDGHNKMLKLIYDNYNVFKLIACCATGTSYEHYIDILVEIEVNASIALLDKMNQEGIKFHQIDEELIHILANAMLSGMFEIVRHDMPRDKAEHYFEGLREFYEAGWEKLLGIIK